ncbi:phage tail protein [Kordiimonas lacus]|uniref:Microcystin-dependent protein n=1 Tax=Kordiimonas lacus TaxID=637679 RepID=A0A1G6T0X4_9PROT|nr:tail fiber protein [Kordiimonas lacus]SDD22127.1 Microcystin-dependent protein [Kordiimonas lacus]
MEGYLGVIEALGFNFTPRNYGACAGGLLAISQYSALFSLLGTAFGGDGRSSFGLPELRGRVPMGFGTGPGLPPYIMGQKVGVESVTLHSAHLPAHTHTHSYAGGGGGTLAAQVEVASTGGKKQTPADGDYLAPPADNFGSIQDNIFTAPADVKTSVPIGGVSISGEGGFDSSAFAIHNTGQNYPFSIVQPSTVINFAICMQGMFPSRS